MLRKYCLGKMGWICVERGRKARSQYQFYSHCQSRLWESMGRVKYLALHCWQRISLYSQLKRFLEFWHEKLSLLLSSSLLSNAWLPGWKISISFEKNAMLLCQHYLLHSLPYSQITRISSNSNLAITPFRACKTVPYCDPSAKYYEAERLGTFFKTQWGRSNGVPEWIMNFNSKAYLLTRHS